MRLRRRVWGFCCAGARCPARPPGSGRGLGRARGALWAAAARSASVAGEALPVVSEAAPAGSCEWSRQRPEGSGESRVAAWPAWVGKAQGVWWGGAGSGRGVRRVPAAGTPPAERLQVPSPCRGPPGPEVPASWGPQPSAA